VEFEQQDEECPILEGGPLLEVAEKICEFCHEITSHEKPNMRSECRSSCFSSDTFRTCVNIFSNPPTQQRRHTRSRHRIRHVL
ncbi:crustacean CHH/MIH/GIH neurohormone family protein, partial [Ostertagia ostertagi]